MTPEAIIPELASTKLSKTIQGIFHNHFGQVLNLEVSESQKSHIFEKTRAGNLCDLSYQILKIWIWDQYLSKNMKLKVCMFQFK